MNTAHRSSIRLVLFFIIMGVVLRVVRHFGFVPLPPNFAPVSAMAMFAAVYLPRRYAFLVPLALMAVADVIIGFDFWPITISIYASFIVSAYLGLWLKKSVRWYTVMGTSVLGSLFFFFVTNAAVWAFTQMYTKNFSGLLHSYIAGLPFLRNTIFGDLFYSVAFFGLYHLVVVYYERRRAASSIALHG